MKQTIFTIFLAALLITAQPFRAQAQMAKNATCPVMPGEAVKEKFYFDYKGERIYFCCRNCIKTFKKNPEKYLKNLNQPNNDAIHHPGAA